MHRHLVHHLDKSGDMLLTQKADVADMGGFGENPEALRHLRDHRLRHFLATLVIHEPSDQSHERRVIGGRVSPSLSRNCSR